MYSRIKLFGHPIHPMLVAFPIAFYTSTLVAYIVSLLRADTFWFRLGLVANIAGVGMALVTAIPGFLDWLTGIPSGSTAKGDGLKHMLLNVSALVLFAITALVYGGQWNSPQPDLALAIILSLIGVFLTVGAGLFGWGLIQKHHIGIELTPEQVQFEPADMRQSEAEAGRTRSRPT